MIPTYALPKHLWAVIVLVTALALAGCGGESSSKKKTTQTIPAYGPSVAMTLPDTLTGGPGAGGGALRVPPALRAMGRMGDRHAGGGDPCSYLGHGSGDPFKNGHTMTKFLVGAIASWGCVADRIIRFIDILVYWGVPTDGTPLDIATGSSDYEAGDATWLSIKEDADGSPLTDDTVVKLYWTAVGVPPVGDDSDVGFYLVWDTTGGDVVGKLVVDVTAIANDPLDPHTPAEDPIYLRLDFDHTAATKIGDMYIGFDSAVHPWVQGWRINVVKRLDGADPRYTAKGVIDMTAQWDPLYVYADTPQLKSFAVADSFGVGAAIASMVDLGLVLYPVDVDSDHLGTFLFTKDDRYYFGGGSPVVYKAVTAGTYKGGQAIVDSSPVDYIRSAADVDTILNGVGGMTGSQYQGCVAGTPAGDCVIFLNALFSADQFGAEANVGTEPAPGDTRRDALEGATYYADACPPSGTCAWDTTAGGVFEMIP